MAKDKEQKPDIIDRLGNWIEKNHSNPGAKIGAGHADAMFRAGLKELSQILPAFPDGVRPVEEPGLAGVPTNIEVVDAKKDAEVRSSYQVSEVKMVASPSPTPAVTNPLEEARRIARERTQEPTRQRER